MGLKAFVKASWGRLDQGQEQNKHSQKVGEKRGAEEKEKGGW